MSGSAHSPSRLNPEKRITKRFQDFSFSLILYLVLTGSLASFNVPQNSVCIQAASAQYAF